LSHADLQTEILSFKMAAVSWGGMMSAIALQRQF
jgi:hypothetical protein